MNLITQRGEPYEYREEANGQPPRLSFSVSQIRRVIHDPFAHVPEDVLKQAQLRGSKLHTRFWKLLAWRDGLRGESPPVIPGLEGYCTAMETWAERNQAKPLQLESKSVNRKLGYAGQFDAQILYGRRCEITLMDLKTGDETLTDPMQLLAYDEMEGCKSKHLLDLYIHPTGTYKEVWITAIHRTTEWPWFLTGLNLLKGRRSHGV